jgi:hypothetical protein
LVSTHDLKVWPEFFAPLERGDKLFELRRDDRDYKVGDWLKLREWAPPDIATAKPGGFTGARLLRRISYVLRPDQAHELQPLDENGQPVWPLLPGFVILGLFPPITDLSFQLQGKRLFLGTVARAEVREAQRYLAGLHAWIEEQKAARERAKASGSKEPKAS